MHVQVQNYNTKSLFLSHAHTTHTHTHTHLWSRLKTLGWAGAGSHGRKTGCRGAPGQPATVATRDCKGGPVRLPARGTPGGVVVGWCGRVEVQRGKRNAGLDGIGVGPTTKAAPVADGELYRSVCASYAYSSFHLQKIRNFRVNHPEIAVFSSDLVASTSPSWWRHTHIHTHTWGKHSPY